MITMETNLLKKVEEQTIRLALDAHNGNKELSAITLGCSVRNLRNKINSYESLAKYRYKTAGFNKENVITQFKSGVTIKKIAENHNTRAETISKFLKSKYTDYKRRLQIYKY